VRSDRERLQDILGAIHKIEQYVDRDTEFSPFSENELLQIWVIHHLQIIGEAASRLSEEFRSSYKEVAWGGMIGMRHMLVHGYFDSDTEIVWKVVEKDLPVLKQQVEDILNTLPPVL
jgi:uncharacterized protein with HEPN domain